MQRHYSGPAEALLAVVKHDVLPRRSTAQRLVEPHIDAARDCGDAAGDVRLPVANLRGTRQIRCWRRTADPVRKRAGEPDAMQPRMAGALHHDERITFEVLARHEPRFFAAARKTADAESAALAERIALEPAVPADHRAFLGLDRAGTARQPLAHEFAEWPLADEADSRGVALRGDRQPALPRDGANLALAQMADRELAGSELPGVERVQEVALVLVAVDAAQEPPAVADAGVMTRRVALGPETPRVVEADAELDLAVAKHVGIGRAARLQLREEMREHALAVLRGEARAVQRDAELLADTAGILEVGRRGAVAVVVLVPVRHEEGLDTMPGIEQEGRGNRGVHASGERDDDACHRSARRCAERKACDRHMAQEIERIACAAQEIVHAKQHEGAAVLRRTGCELIAVEPDRPDDRAVEAGSGIVLADAARERDAEHRAPRRPLPEVDARDRFGAEVAPRLLARFAYNRLDEGLAGLEVAGRLVEHDAARGALLHEQEAAAVLRDGRDGDVELQGHEPIIRSKGASPSAVQRCCWRVSASGSLAIQISSK